MRPRNARPQRTPWIGPAFCLLAVAAVVLAPSLASAASGYNLTFSRGAGSTSNAHVDLVLLDSQDQGNGKLQVRLQTAGTLDLTDSNYQYYVYFGGAAASSSFASVTFSNNTTVGASIVPTGFGTVAYSLSNGGTMLTFLMNESDLPPAASFTMNAIATSGGSPPGVSSIGSAFQPLQNVVSTIFWIYVGLAIVVVVVVVVVIVVLLVVRRKKTPPGPPTPPPMAFGTPVMPTAAPGPLPPPPPPPPPSA